MAEKVHIVGAGLTGTCLALSLVQAKYEGEIALYDRRDRFDRERHWCAWGPLPRYLRPYVAHSWVDFELGACGRRSRRRMTGSPYVHIPASAFFREAHRRLRRCENVDLLFGEAAEPNEIGDGYVIDATDRPCGDPILIQSTVSRLVRFDRSVAGRAVHLMDCRARDESTRLITSLPFGPREVLIEATRVDARGPRPTDDFAALDAYLAEEFPSHYRVVSTMEDAVPVSFHRGPANFDPKRATLGVCGGAVRGGPREGLSGVVSQVESLTKAIVGHRTLPHAAPHSALRWVESIILDSILAGPTLAQRALEAMFDLPAETTSRYLRGKPTWSDVAGLLLSLPTRPFWSAPEFPPGHPEQATV